MVTADSIYDPQNPDKKQPGDLAQPDLSGQAATSGAGPSSTPGAGGAKGPSSSGQFTNINAYMNANKDFAQDQGGLAGKMVGNIQNAADQDNQQIGKAKSDFQQGADAGKSTYDRPDLVQQAFADPIGFTNNQDLMNQWGGVRNAQYTGPQSLADIQGADNLTNLTTGAQNVQDMANESGNESGRFSLLNQMFGRSGYNSGQQKLDNLLLQSDPNQVSNLSNSARTSARQVDQSLTGAQTQAAQTAQNYQDQANQVSNQVNDKLYGANGAVPTLQSSLTQKLSDQKTSANKLMSDLQNHTLSAAEATTLGLAPGQTTYGFTINPSDSNIFNQSYVNNANVANVASQDDYNKYQALMQLAGTQGTFLPSQYDAKQTFDPTKAVNSANLASALASAKNNYTAQQQTYAQAILGQLDGSHGASDLGHMANLPVTGQNFDPSGQWGWNTYGNPYDMTSISGVNQLSDVVNSGWNNRLSSYGPNDALQNEVNNFNAQIGALQALLNSNQSLTPMAGTDFSPHGGPMKRP